MRRRLLAGAIAVALLLAVWQAAAEAHVSAKITTAVDGTSTVTFTFLHGCGKNGQTSSLKIKFPDGTGDIAPQSAPVGFSANIEGTELTWTGPPIPYNTEADFVTTATIPGQKGETVFLPTIQGCGTSEDAWIDKSPDPEAINPGGGAAPRVVLTQTVAAAQTTVAPSSVGPAVDPNAPTSTKAPSGSTPSSAGQATGTTGAPLATQPASTNPQNSSVGTTVFIVTCLIIAVGALVIYLRMPKRKMPSWWSSGSNDGIDND